MTHYRRPKFDPPAGRLGDYYEAVFAELVADGTLKFDAVFFDAERWYEIDTTLDLREAEKLFSRPRCAFKQHSQLK